MEYSSIESSQQQQQRRQEDSKDQSKDQNDQSSDNTWFKAYHTNVNPQQRKQQAPTRVRREKPAALKVTLRLPILRDYKYKVVIKTKKSLNLRDHKKELGESTLGVPRSPLQDPVKFRLFYDHNILIACTNNMEKYAFEIGDVKQFRISGEDVDGEAYLKEPTKTICRAEGHPCTPRCALCKGPHKTYSKEYELKFYKARKDDRPTETEEPPFARKLPQPNEELTQARTIAQPEARLDKAEYRPGQDNMVRIGKLATSTKQVTGMLRRIRNKRRGLKEKEAIRLLRLMETELGKLNIRIKKAFKSELGVPVRTPTERLINLGVHNTLEELRDAQIAAQLKWLDETANGRWLLGKLNLEAERSRTPLSEDLPREVGANIKVSRIPKNMHPEGDADRKEQAVDIVNPRASVLTDSQTACRNFLHDWFEGTHRSRYYISCGCRTTRDTEGMRRLTPQPEVYFPTEPPSPAATAVRLRFPLPHKNLSREEHFIQRLQTVSIPPPERLNAWYPSSLLPPACTHCGYERADAYHVVWACQKILGLVKFTNPTTERWEVALRSEDLSQHLLLATRDAIESKFNGTPQ
ncbi:hypothetical protein HPB47_008282 [Ixodes persulcatus]|uniref:Uncharacterized protein n=1 Tax=Ixodes persulcatus TaxID=34615 RepID=A0AC60P5J1_IXOPE|nr:hypothetical protein HPB47_008282 [Ixodes persulcatus]